MAWATRDELRQLSSSDPLALLGTALTGVLSAQMLSSMAQGTILPYIFGPLAVAAACLWYWRAERYRSLLKRIRERK